MLSKYLYGFYLLTYWMCKYDDKKEGYNWQGKEYWAKWWK